METTFNNIFKNAVKDAVKVKIDKEMEEQMALNAFLASMEVIKANLESAFINTAIRVKMAMFGVPEKRYTTISIFGPTFRISCITSNNAVYKGKDWDYDAEEKDLRVEGKPMTYDELITIVANQYIND